VRFGPWYSLHEAGDHAPAAEGVLQIRLAAGLIDYPRGKSAMVHYEHTRDVRASALALATRYTEAVVCRHLIEVDPTVDLAAFHAKLEAEFVRRFGTAPSP
jgi:hypothetical protein